MFNIRVVEINSFDLKKQNLGQFLVEGIQVSLFLIFMILLINTENTHSARHFSLCFTCATTLHVRSYKHFQLTDKETGVQRC